MVYAVLSTNWSCRDRDLSEIETHLDRHCCHPDTDQVQAGRLAQQLHVGAAAVDTGLEVHLVPGHKHLSTGSGRTEQRFWF